MEHCLANAQLMVFGEWGLGCCSSSLHWILSLRERCLAKKIRSELREAVRWHQWEFFGCVTQKAKQISRLKSNPTNYADIKDKHCQTYSCDLLRHLKSFSWGGKSYFGEEPQRWEERAKRGQEVAAGRLELFTAGHRQPWAEQKLQFLMLKLSDIIYNV